MPNTHLTAAREIAVTSPDGVTLATAGKYCPDDLRPIPRLCPLTVRENGTYPVPAGYAGFSAVTVCVGTPTPDACTHPDCTVHTSTAATCHTPGSEQVTCHSCGLSFTRTIPALPHDDLITTTPATCERGGYTTHTCRTCGRVTLTDATEPLGHAWGAPEYDDSVSTGQSVTCERCGTTEEYSA